MNSSAIILFAVGALVLYGGLAVTLGIYIKNNKKS